MTDPDHTAPAATGKTAAPARSTKETVRIVAAIVVGGLIIAFAVLNGHRVSVNWIFGTWSTPLIVVIAVTFLLGLAVGVLVEGRRTRAKRRRHGAAR